jgi:hypothetical protein
MEIHKAGDANNTMSELDSLYIPPDQVNEFEKYEESLRDKIESLGLPKLYGHLLLRQEEQLLLFPEEPVHGDGWVSQVDQEAVYTQGLTPEFTTPFMPKRLAAVPELAEVFDLDARRMVAL